MPYPISPNSIAEVTLVQRYDGQTMLSILHYRYFGTSDILDGATALTTLVDDLNDNDAGRFVHDMSLAQVDTVTYTQIVAQWILPSRWARALYVPFRATGQRAVDGIASSSAAVVTKRTDFPAPHGVGSLHIGGLAMTDAFASQWTLATRLLTDAVGNAIKRPVSIAEGTLKPVVLNRGTPAISQEILTAITQPEVRTMRSRVVGRGV